MTQNLWRSSVTPAVIFCRMHRGSHFPAVACFSCSYICVWVCLWWRLLYCAGLEYCDLQWMAVVVPVAQNSPLGLATSALLPLVGVVLSVQASWSRYHATFPSFALLHGPMHSNPPYTVSLYHLFRLLWIIQKNIFHIRTLSLLLLHFLSLYLPNHSPPPFYQWCDGPHCGVVVILQYKLSFPDAPQKDVSFSAHASVWVCSYLDSFSTLQRELKKNSIFCPKP